MSDVPRAFRSVIATVLIGSALFNTNVCSIVRAHDDLNLKIQKVSAELRETPDDAMLRLKRAELHRLHGDWDAAKADYDRVQALQPNRQDLAFYRGRMLLEAGQPQLAVKRLDGYLAERPNHPEALLQRAKAYAALKQYERANDDFGRATGAADRPKPDWYLQWAGVLMRAGDNNADAALAALDAGKTKLGNSSTLVTKAIEIERGRNNYQAALTRVDTLPQALRTSPHWWAMRAELLSQLGRRAEAGNAYRGALNRIEALPQGRRGSSAIRGLELSIRSVLKELASK